MTVKQPVISPLEKSIMVRMYGGDKMESPSKAEKAALRRLLRLGYVKVESR